MWGRGGVWGCGEELGVGYGGGVGVGVWLCGVVEMLWGGCGCRALQAFASYQ